MNSRIFRLNQQKLTDKRWLLSKMPKNDQNILKERFGKFCSKTWENLSIINLKPNISKITNKKIRVFVVFV